MLCSILWSDCFPQQHMQRLACFADVEYSWPVRSDQVVEFAEKPTGDALRKMQVDTTVLGVDPET